MASHVKQKHDNALNCSLLWEAYCMCNKWLAIEGKYTCTYVHTIVQEMRYKIHAELWYWANCVSSPSPNHCTYVCRLNQPSPHYLSYHNIQTSLAIFKELRNVLRILTSNAFGQCWSPIYSKCLAIIIWSMQWWSLLCKNVCAERIHTSIKEAL